MVYQPPVRTSFYSTAIFNTSNKLEPNKNYIWLTTKGRKRVYYYIGSDKVSNSRTYKDKEDLKIIEVENKELVDIIYKSYEKNKRDYLFEGNNKKPSSQNTLLHHLKQITKLPKINFNMMRAIYITDFYSNINSYKNKQELAQKMRHSIATAEKNYFKILTHNKPKINDNEEIKELKKEIELLKIQNNELKQQLDKYKETETEYKKKRRDIIYNANKKNIKPKEETINKYNIKYDDEIGKYI